MSNFFKFIVCLFVFLLSGCDIIPTVNPPAYRHELLKERMLDRNYFLVEHEDWRQLGLGANQIILQTYFLVCGKSVSFEEFNRQPAHWQEWIKCWDTKVRILGIVAKGTRYRINKIQTGYDQNMQFITILSGPFSGRNTEFRGLSQLTPKS